MVSNRHHRLKGRPINTLFVSVWEFQTESKMSEDTRSTQDPNEDKEIVHKLNQPYLHVDYPNGYGGLAVPFADTSSLSFRSKMYSFQQTQLGIKQTRYKTPSSKFKIIHAPLTELFNMFIDYCSLISGPTLMWKCSIQKRPNFEFKNPTEIILSVKRYTLKHS